MNETITLTTQDASSFFFKLDLVEKCCRMEEPNHTDVLSVGNLIWKVCGKTITCSVIDVGTRMHASFSFDFDSTSHPDMPPIAFGIENGSLLPPKHSKTCRNGKQQLEIQLSGKFMRIVRKYNEVQIACLTPINILDAALGEVEKPPVTFAVETSSLAKVSRFMSAGKMVDITNQASALHVDLKNEGEIVLPCEPNSPTGQTSVRVPSCYLEVWRRPLPRSFSPLVNIGWTENCFYIGQQGLETLFGI